MNGPAQSPAPLTSTRAPGRANPYTRLLPPKLSDCQDHQGGQPRRPRQDRGEVTEEMRTVTRTFERHYGVVCEAYPDDRHVPFLQRNFGCARKTYNLLVEQGNERDRKAAEWHAEDPEGREGQAYPYEWQTYPSFYEEHPYLQEADTRALLHAQQAYFEARASRYERGGGRPRFKSKWDYPRTYTTDNQDYAHGIHQGQVRIVEIEGRHRKGEALLCVPKLPRSHVRNVSEKTGKRVKQTHVEVDYIRIRLPREIPEDAEIRTATLGQRADGSYYASLSVVEHVEVEMLELDGTDDPQDLIASCVGGDLGLKTFLVGSDGVCYDDPGDYSSLERRLRREERKLGKQRSRLMKRGLRLADCRNYQRQRRKVARLRARVANKREDFRHKLSRRLVDGHSLIVLEDLNVRGLLKNHCLARGISEAAWGDFISKVRYKAAWAGVEFVQVGRWYPSTRTCSRCGHRTGPHGPSDLGTREWVCPDCGATHDRDVNAAVNVLLEGLRILSESDSAYASQWSAVRAALVARLSEPIGRVAPGPTGGTPGVACASDGVGARTSPDDLRLCPGHGVAASAASRVA